MKLTIDIPAHKYVRASYGFSIGIIPCTKQGVLDHILRGFSYTFSTNVRGYCPLRSSEDTVRTFHIEKRRKVTKAVTDPKKLKKGIKREVVTPGHWVVHYYDIPVDLLRIAKLKVIQHSRHFTIEKL
jgi:hypothetical protein